MGISLIECGFGYVESNSAARILFGAQDGVEFDTEIEALHDLARTLYLKYKLENCSKPSLKNCCKETLSKLPGAKRCANCGGNCKVEAVNFEEFGEWICQLLNATCDSYGSDELYEYDEETTKLPVGGWTPWFSASALFKRGAKSLLCLPNDAEAFIIEALGEDGVDPEDLFFYSSIRRVFDLYAIHFVVFVSNQVEP